MPLCIFTLENNKYYIKKYQQDLIDSIKNMVDKLNNEELFLTTLKPTVQNNELIIENSIINYMIIESDKIEELTIKYMKDFGIGNVRSDLYPNVYLNTEEIEYLTNKMKEEDKPVIERIAILDGQIEVLKDVYSKLDKEEIIINTYSDYTKYIYSSNFNNIKRISNSFNNEERNFIQYYPHTISLYNDIENYFDSLSTHKLIGNNQFIIKEIKEKFLTSYLVTEDIIKAKTAKIKYDKLINKYGDKKSIEESLQDLLTKKLKLIESDEYKNLDDV